MRSFNGPLGPLSVAMAAALFVLAGSTPADAQGPDDDDRPTKEPAPIVTPVQPAASRSADELDAALEVRALRTGLQARLDALTAQQDALSRAGATALPVATTPWTRPAQGRITQRFGPTSLRVEPARVVDGVYY